jgi:hypothetical protein
MIARVCPYVPHIFQYGVEKFFMLNNVDLNSLCKIFGLPTTFHKKNLSICDDIGNCLKYLK